MRMWRMLLGARHTCFRERLVVVVTSVRQSVLFFNYTRNLELYWVCFVFASYVERIWNGNLELISCKTNKENQAGDSRFITQ